jgi:hypothetical protein
MRYHILINTICYVLAIVVLHTGYYILYTGEAYAQEIGIATSKQIFDVGILRGDTYEGEFAITNMSDEVALPVHIQLSLWNLKEDSDDVEFVLAEDALNAVKWFTLHSGPLLLIPPNDGERVMFSIQPPADAVAGSYFVMMRLQAVLPEHYFTQQGPRFIPEVGVLFFIRVVDQSLDGTPGLFNAEIVSLEPKDVQPISLLQRITPLARANVYEDVVTALLAKVKNTGIYHFQASGFVEIQNMFGAQVARAELPKKYLLPNRTRSVDVQAADNGKLGFMQKVPFVGKYTAIMVMDVPESTEPIIAQFSFWVFPWKEVFATLFVLALLLLLHRRLWRAGKALVRGRAQNAQ